MDLVRHAVLVLGYDAVLKKRGEHTSCTTGGSYVDFKKRFLGELVPALSFDWTVDSASYCVSIAGVCRRTVCMGQAVEGDFGS